LHAFNYVRRLLYITL